MDVYKPRSNRGENLYYYDVNSLYPTMMAKFPMPVGKPVAFEGDIRSVRPSAQGIFYCIIQTTRYLKHPVLQKKYRLRMV